MDKKEGGWFEGGRIVCARPIHSPQRPQGQCVIVAVWRYSGKGLWRNTSRPAQPATFCRPARHGGRHGKARPCLPGPGWAFYFRLDESIMIGRDFEGYPMMQARIAVCVPVNEDISLAVIPAKAGIHAYRDVGGRAASGTGRRGKRGYGGEGMAGFIGWRVGCRSCCHSRYAGMAWLNHWIPRPSFQTRLYHLHPCRRACAGMTRGWLLAFSE